jgi:hypothetical protein
MSNALAKINKRVAQLAKKHPGAKRTTLQKQAGREYKAGKLGRVKKKSVGKVYHRRAKVGKVKRKRVASVSRNTDKTDNKRVSISVGSPKKRRTVVYKGFVIVGDVRTEGKRSSVRWYLTDGKGGRVSEDFITLSSAKAWARHLSK